jgi:serine/threonine protein kinase
VLPPDAPGGDCPRCLLRLGLRAVLFGEVQETHLAGPAATSDDVAPEIELERYRIVGKLGEGGCGVVYRALQLEPLRRDVALKVIKLGIDTRSVIARFEMERQTLAMMEHPGIAKVFDAGSTKAGRPYFAMELVQGKAITTWCDEQGLGIAERLELFSEVCQAVQHAHQKGIIHRDLKPSNVLVSSEDGRARAKIIDFGVARATARQRLADQTIYTAFDQFVGTPAYMSPEQTGAAGEDIDTRSDIYSLGVLLYELLTGRPPFDPERLQNAALDEVCRIIREEEPPRPSTQIARAPTRGPNASNPGSESGRTRQRIASPSSIACEFKGDLDWIVMKALEKDRERRYPTAGAFAADIQCVLGDQPVVARPPSALYRFRKMARRNRAAVTAGAIVIVVLMAASVMSTWRFSQEKKARERAVAAEATARTQALRSDQVTRLLKEMLAKAGPSVALGRDTTLLRELLDATTERLGSQVLDAPEVRAELLQVIGHAYEDLKDYDKAEAAHHEALSLREKAFGASNLLVADSMIDLGGVLNARAIGRDFEEAEKVLRRALFLRAGSTNCEPAKIADAQATLAWTLRGRKQLVESEALERQALVLRRRLLPAGDPAIIRSLGALALLLTQDETRASEAEALAREALQLQEQASSSPNDPARIQAVDTLVCVLQDRRKFSEAESISRDAVILRRKLFGDENLSLAASLSNLSYVLLQQEKLEEAEQAAREAISIQRKVRGIAGPYINTCGVLVDILQRQHRWPEVEAAARGWIPLIRAATPPQPDTLKDALFWFGSALQAQSKWAEAEPVFDEALELCARRLEQPGQPGTVRCMSIRRMLGEVLLRLNKPAEAEPLLLAAYEGLKGKWEKIDFEKSMSQLAELCETNGRPAKAAEWKSKLADFKKMHPAN